VEVSETRGTTALVYLQLHSSLYTGTVHVLSSVAGVHPSGLTADQGGYSSILLRKEFEILRSPGSGASLLKTGQVYNYCAMRSICLLNRAISPTFLPLYPRHSRVAAASTQVPGLPDLGKPSLPPSPKFTATWRPFTATKFFTTAIFTAIFP
jgi:hypothetical protein